MESYLRAAGTEFFWPFFPLFPHVLVIFPKVTFDRPPTRGMGTDLLFGASYLVTFSRVIVTPRGVLSTGMYPPQPHGGCLSTSLAQREGVPGKLCSQKVQTHKPTKMLYFQKAALGHFLVIKRTETSSFGGPLVNLVMTAYAAKIVNLECTTQSRQDFLVTISEGKPGPSPEFCRLTQDRLNFSDLS